MKTSRIVSICTVCICIFSTVGYGIDLLQQDEDKIRQETWEPSLKDMTTKYSGTVFLDGKPLAGARVTDGIHFVETGEDGRYEIDIQFDAMTPLLRTRVIAVSWPEGTWPERHPVSGRLRFWKRVADVQDATDKVDFFLKTRVIEPPFVVSFGADPHENLWDNWNYTMPEEIARASDETPVHLGMLLGDLTYAQLDGAPVIYANFEKYAREFPVSFLHVIGNHDWVGGPPDNELVGYGSFHKWLNPKRLSFDVANIHVVLFDYWFLNQQGVDWLDADLDAIPKDRPVYIFTHSWGSYFDGLCARHPNIRLIHGGHSHKTQYYGKSGNADFWSFYAYYRTMYIDGDDYEFVDRSAGGNAGYSFYGHGMGRGGRVSRLSEVKLNGKSQRMPEYVAPEDAPAPAEPPPKDTYDIRFIGEPTGRKPAKRFGVRVHGEDGEVTSFYFDNEKKLVNMAGRKYFFDPMPVYPACMPTKHPDKPVWQAYLDEDAYLKLSPEEQAKPEQKAKFKEARRLMDEWAETKKKMLAEHLAANPPSMSVKMDVNICPGRIQVFVNDITAYIQFTRVGPAKYIECFAEEGEATFKEVTAFETGAGYNARGYDRPARETRLR